MNKTKHDERANSKLSIAERFFNLKNQKWLWIFLAALFYLSVSLYSMSGIMSSCGTRVYSPGDSTAGLITRYSVSPDRPLWGYTDKFNYPAGENLYQPVNYSGVLYFTGYWVFAKIAGPVCGLNLFNITGFVLSALTGCLFIYWLIRNKWTAVLAGYAVAFTPYFQVKVGGHPSYGFQVVLITLLWLIMLNWQYRRKLYIGLLGVNLAALVYWDPYFSLLGATVLLGAMVPLVVHSIFKKQAKRLLTSIIPRFLIAGTLALFLSAPILYVRIHYSNQINASVKSGRGDIEKDVYQFTNRPIEYILPAETNPIAKKILGTSYQTDLHHSSNTGEYTVGLSLMMLATTLCFFIVLVWERLAGIKSKISNVSYFGAARSLLVFCGIGVLGFFIALPPRYGPLRGLSGVIIEHITMWRAFSRLYIVINIVLVGVFSLALVFYAKSIKSKSIKNVLFAVICTVLFIEYQAPSFPGFWSYDSSVSHIYKTLRDRTDIKTVASYPLDETDKLGYLSNYLTLNKVYNKPMLNGISSLVPEAAIRRGIADIRDPQTLPALRVLGITAVIINGEQIDPNIPGLELIDEDLGTQYYTLKPVRLYKVLPGPTTDYVSVPTADGIVQNHNFKTSAVEFAVVNSAKIDALPLYGRTNEGGSCFTIRSEKANPIKIELAEGLNKQVYTISQRPTRLSFGTGDISINVLNDSKDVLILSDFGCQN